MGGQQPVVVQGLDALLGLSFRDVAHDRVVTEVVVRSEHHQRAAIAHGGLYSALVDATATAGAALWYAGRGSAVGVSNFTNFLQAVRSGLLRAVGTPVQQSDEQQLWTVKVHDEDHRLVATGEVLFKHFQDAADLGR